MSDADQFEAMDQLAEWAVEHADELAALDRARVVEHMSINNNR